MITRREWLKYTGSTLMASSLINTLVSEALADSSARPWLLATDGTSTATKSTDPYVKPDIPGSVMALDPTSGTIKQVGVPFFGHELISHPVEPMLCFSSVKWGNKGALVDFKTGKMIHLVEAPKDTRFFGHSVWSKDGSKLYASAHFDPDNYGEIIVFDRKNFSILNRIPTQGRQPHQIIYTAESEVAVQNQTTTWKSDSEDKSSVITFIDLRAEKVTKLVHNAGAGLGHLLMDRKRGDFWSGGIIRPKTGTTGPLQTRLVKTHGDRSDLIQVPESQAAGELLSLNLSTINPSLLAVTVLESAHVGIFDLDQMKFLLVQKFSAPTRGVYFSESNPSRLYLNLLQGDLLTLDLKKGSEWRIETVGTQKFANGSHMNSVIWKAA